MAISRVNGLIQRNCQNKFTSICSIFVPSGVLTLKQQTDKFTAIKYILSHITIRRHVSVAAATIIRVPLENANSLQRLHKIQKEIKEKNILVPC